MLMVMLFASLEILEVTSEARVKTEISDRSQLRCSAVFETGGRSGRISLLRAGKWALQIVDGPANDAATTLAFGCSAIQPLLSLCASFVVKCARARDVGQAPHGAGIAGRAAILKPDRSCRRCGSRGDPRLLSLSKTMGKADILADLPQAVR
jgi:hypothetical protein